MIAAELRVGNLVKAKNTNGNPNKWVVIKVKPEHIVTCSDKPDWFKPIPLTEKWLKKLNIPFDYGFEDEGYKIYYLFKHIQIEVKNGKLLKNYIIILDREVKINYLHKVQNLIFAITKQELIK